MAQQDIARPRHDQAQAGEVDLRDVVYRLSSAARIVWKHRRWMARMMAGAVIVAAVIAFLIPNQYESTARILPPDPETLSNTSTLAALIGAGTLGGASGLAGSLLNSKTPGALSVATLKSRTVQDDLINRFDLRRVYNKKYYLDARKKLASQTDIDEDRESGIVAITVTDRDPSRAQQMAQAYVEELDTVVMQLSTSSARRERIFLEGRLNTVQQDLEAASQRLSEFSSRNSTVDIADQEKTELDAAAKLQGELIAARAELRSIETFYASENVRVRSIRARIDELNRQLQNIAGSSFGNNADLKADQLYPSLRRLPLLGVTYYDLYRRVKVQESVYEVLTKQYELAKVQEAKEIPTLKVLDAPNRPERKTFPPRILITVFGSIVAFLACSSWIVIRERSADATEDKLMAFVANIRTILSGGGKADARAHGTL